MDFTVTPNSGGYKVDKDVVPSLNDNNEYFTKLLEILNNIVNLDICIFILINLTILYI